MLWVLLAAGMEDVPAIGGTALGTAAVEKISTSDQDPAVRRPAETGRAGTEAGFGVNGIAVSRLPTAAGDDHLAVEILFGGDLPLEAVEEQSCNGTCCC